MAEEVENRRPLKSRGTVWAHRLAAVTARAGITPDAVSAASVGFALLGGLLLTFCVPGPWQVAALLGAAACIQLRLLCNLLDGMVAVEHGKGGPLGPLWNEVPDRVADVLFLVGAGHAVAGFGLTWGVELGWAAALGAVLTAYVREFGRGLGLPGDFAGPMAKPHRMFALTVACLGSLAEPLVGGHGHVLGAALAIIALGTVVTTARRLTHVANGVRAREKSGTP
jgi:phosphatidylglycerophosphate synthase